MKNSQVLKNKTLIKILLILHEHKNNRLHNAETIDRQRPI